MPESTPRCPAETARHHAPRRVLRGDSEGVSEVIGYLLVFGILSMVLVLSMSAFSAGQESAEQRAIQLRAESAAARVAGVVVQTAVLWEKQHTATSDVAVAYLVDLPQQFEGADYVIRLEPKVPAGCTTACTAPDQVRVLVPSVQVDVTAPIFAASAPASLAICDPAGAATYTEASGGILYVRINAPSGQPAPACGANSLFLEST